jgi:hypothetical protein
MQDLDVPHFQAMGLQSNADFALDIRVQLKNFLDQGLLKIV